MFKDKEIKLEGERILVFGGVYSNLEALKKMRAIAAIEQIEKDHVICTGDIVGYCAQPEECLKLVQEWGIHSILGNVEIQLRDGEEDCGCDFDDGSRCDLFSRRWYPFAQKRVSTDSLNWLESLPDHLRFTFGGKKFIVVHGAYRETSGYVFQSSPWPVKTSNFIDSSTDVVLAGHCGLPFSDQKNNNLWVNAGVIGMPANDGTKRVWYLIIESNDQGHLTFKRRSFEYDFASTVDLMKAEKLPTEYALTLSTGLWDNCEILPETETNNQGIPIQEEEFIFCE